MTRSMQVALGGLYFAAFSAMGLAFGYFFQGFRWSGSPRRAFSGLQYPRWASHLGLSFWLVCLALSLAVSAVAGAIAVVVALT